VQEVTVAVHGNDPHGNTSEIFKPFTMEDQDADGNTVPRRILDIHVLQ
jgi:hypothetical protein